MKKFTKVVEAYEMEMENYEDFAMEHAKKVVASYIDGQLDGKTLQDAYNELANDMLIGAGEGPQEMTIQAIQKLLNDLFEEAGNLETVSEESDEEPNMEEMERQPHDTINTSDE